MNTSLQLFLTSIIFLINFPVLNIGDQLKQLLEKENEISTEYCSHNFKEQESSLSTSNNGSTKKEFQNSKSESKSKQYSNFERDTFIMKSISLGINKTIEMFNYNSEDKNPDFIEKNNNEIINIIEAADFTFQAFAPQNFLNFRNLQNINEIFNNSFKTSPLTTKKNTGKSKSLFYYTTDRKFVIKTMSSTEKEVLISLLSEYFSHFCEHPNTLLPKLLGSYRFKDTRSEYYLIVMTNIYPYPMDKTLNRIYDLKGSIFNREASIQEESEINFRLLDVDFRHHFKDGLRIPLSVHSLLAETLENDCELLKKYNIMDYSLLVVIKVVENENYEGEKAATTEENSLDTFVSPKNSEVSGQNIVTNEMTLPSQSQNFSNGLSVTFINNKHELQKLSVYIGIIDILQTYNWKRKVENIVKCKLCILGDLATIQNPAKYAIRFKQFLTIEVFRPEENNKLEHDILSEENIEQGNDS